MLVRLIDSRDPRRRVLAKLILRKYLAWLSSTSTLLALGWMMIPKAFSGIADWLSPVFGPAFRPELYLAFLMFGPSLTYTPLLITWAAAGVVGGFFSRGVWRSVAAGTLSTLTIILLMIGNGLLIITSLGGLGNLSGGFSGLSIPPPPPGLTLADIVNAPLVGQVISALTTSGGFNPISIAELFLINFAVNRIIHTVSFIASAVLFSKLFPPHPQPVPVATPTYAPIPTPAPVPAQVTIPGQLLPLTQRVDPESKTLNLPATPAQTQKLPESKPDTASAPTLTVKTKDEKTERQEKQEEPADTSTSQSASKVAVVLFILALSFSALLIPAGNAQILHASGSGGSPTGEQLILNLQRDGTLKMSYSTNLTALPTGIPSDYRLDEFQGIVGAFIFAFNGTIDLGQNGNAGGGGGGLSTIVSLLPPNGFLAVYQNVDQTTGKARADRLANDFQQGFGVTLTATVSMMLPAFGGSGGPMYLAIYQGDGTVSSTGLKILNLVQATGVGTVLSSPKVFASNFGAEAGYLNFNAQGNSTGTPQLTPGAQISADLTKWGNFYGRGTFTLGVREILGTQGVIGPSSVAGSTTVQLDFPGNSTILAYWPLNATLDTTRAQLSYSMNSTATPVTDIYVTFSNVFPQHITVSRTLDPASPVPSGTTVTEHISVTNLGNESIKGAVASEKRLFQTYRTLQLGSASANMSLGDIGPQATAQGTIVFKVTSDGLYTMPGTEIAYTDQNQSISKTTEQTYLQATFSIMTYAQQLVQGTAPWSYLFLLIAILPPILQLSRTIRNRRPKEASRPVEIKSQKREDSNW